MKVLFAVNNDEISNAIVKRYQKNFKEIISYKNVYYFNAIIKELQKDSTYDRIVISEELEPFANNNYDTIDKFIFEKLDNISDEAINKSGRDTDIILICSDRRTKSDEILIKLFGIGIYSAIIGNDRSIDEICRLINTPRNKKDAKIYYKIDSGEVMYQAENENSVSEVEVQNILAHYKKLGRNEEKYVESFDNIASQYTDNQLKIIIRYLPMHVKAVLEVQSPKYRELTAVKGDKNQINKPVNTKKSQKQSLNVKMIDKESTKKKISRPIVIPSKMDLNYTKKLIKQNEELDTDDDEDFIDIMEDMDDIPEERPNMPNTSFDIDKELNEDKFDLDKALAEDDEEDEDIEEIENSEVSQEEKPKRGRGRPRKNPITEDTVDNKPKRGRGRPRKNTEEIENKLDKDIINDEENDDDELNLFELDEDEGQEESSSTDSENDEEDLDLFSFDQEEDDDESEKDEEKTEKDDAIDLFDLDDQEDTHEPVEEDVEDDDDSIDLFDIEDQNDDEEDDTGDILFDDEDDFNNVQLKPISNTNTNSRNLISSDKKIVAFVGTTKNGTSFVVNNLAEYLSSIGINTAILDMSKNKNAYYIYTDNQDKLRKIASESMYKLKANIAEGIKINKNLSIFTDVPGEEKTNTSSEIDTILNTLLNNFSVLLIDCDFETNNHYFERAQEIYLVQTMDVLTIQPLTAFLKQLKNRNILKPEKLRVVINKEQRMKNLPLDLLIGGISNYNSPDMTLMDNLFNKETVKRCIIPFEMQNYTKYLESLVDCKLSLNGYTKKLMVALKELANMVYPLVGKDSYNPGQTKYNSNFSSEMNTTLNKMKKNYK